MLQQIHFLTLKKEWLDGGLDRLCEVFPFWSEATVKRTANSLADMSLIEKKSLSKNKFDRTVSYRVKHKEIRTGQSDQMEQVNLHSSEQVNMTSSEQVNMTSCTYIDKKQERDKKEKGWGDCPAGVNVTAWHEWTEYKGGNPHKSTVTKLVNLLREYPQQIQQQMVDESIRNGWKGVFPPKNYQQANSRTEQNYAAAREFAGE